MISCLVTLPSQPVRGLFATESAATFRPEPLVRTLSALVPAAVEGVVQDVILVLETGGPDIDRIADEAGCAIATGAGPADAMAQALRMAKAAQAMVLEAGCMPERGFHEELADELAAGARHAVMRRAEDSFVTRLLPVLSPLAAVVAPRESLAAAKVEGLASALRAVPRRERRLLRARARFAA